MDVLIALVIILVLFTVPAYNDFKFHCNNHVLNNKRNQTTQLNSMVSYCSMKSDLRDSHQNVISYSLYGNFSDPQHYLRYAEPIKYILSNISQFYPGN